MKTITSVAQTREGAACSLRTSRIAEKCQDANDTRFCWECGLTRRVFMNNELVYLKAHNCNV